MNLYVGILIVLATIVVGSVLYVIIARISPEGGREHKTPTNVYAVTAGAMSLLIAFTLSLTFTQYNNAQQAAQTEAEQVIAMSRAATFMKPKLRDQVRDQLVCYAQEIINDEWPAMKRGDTNVPDSVRGTLSEMDTLLAANVPQAGVGLDIWETANTARHGAHLQRLQSAGNSVPMIVWLLLIFGSLITIVSLFVYADRSKPAWGHALVVVGPLFIASAALVVIAFFDHPFSDSSGGIQPTAMEFTLDYITTTPVGDAPLPSCPNPS